MQYGFEETTDLFRRLAAAGRLHHAYVFFGPRAAHAALFARRFAFFLERGVFEETGVPLSDAFFLAAPDDGRTLGIDTVRSARNFLFQRPVFSSHRFVLIAGAEALSVQAQAALLKIAEEPPEHGIIVITAGDIGVLAPPLRSRFHRFYCGRAPSVGSAVTAEGTAASLSSLIEASIVKLYRDGVVQHAPKIARLLRLMTTVGRYQVNEKIQRKALDALLRS